jgi:gas vesicle protein
MGGFLKGLLFGAVIFGAIALFTAPQSGAETRQMIREKSEALRDQATDAMENTREQINTVISDTRKRGEKVVEAIQSE